ncbi:MAG: aldo/keto reductase [Planctomycetota bacterium]|jgi:aryl-alcohol dehydrogenase-like predicted oxidoreductase
MEHRNLGRTDLSVPTVIFGAWAIGGYYWGDTRDREALDALWAALDGETIAIDTAPIYGYGHSERLCGVALDGRRDRAIVMTKCGIRWDDPLERGVLAFQGRGPFGRDVKVFFNSRPDSVRLECERSLERLGVERIDLFQVHRPDETTPIADTMGALLELRAEGKIREIGVSNYSAEQLEEARVALGDVPLASDQPEYSLVRRDIERDVLPWCREHGVGTVVYSPLEQGLLTGKVRADRVIPDNDARSGRATFTQENRAKVNALLDEVVAPAAERLDATYAQVVLAWTLAQPGVTSVLAGARTTEQVLENARAGSLELEPAELEAIDRAFDTLELKS